MKSHLYNDYETVIAPTVYFTEYWGEKRGNRKVEERRNERN
jgi:hypothetical protein